jgi:hypothetical protein
MSARSCRTLRVVLLLAACLLGALLGARAVLVRRPLPSDVIYSGAVAAVMAGLCIADGRARRRPVPLLAEWVVFLIWPLAAPCYAVWSRGARGLLVVLLLGAALLAAYVVGFVGGAVLLQVAAPGWAGPL